MKSNTALEIPGWYVEFQAAVLRQLPRPGQIDQITAEGWTKNQESLKKNLSECLVPPSTGIIKIDRSSPFNPAKFIRKGWKIEEQDERSLALSEVDLTKFLFEDMLKSGESSIQGEEKLGRLKQVGQIRLDAKIFQTLWENQHLIPASWKEKISGNTCRIFFDGSILRHSNGLRYVLYLYWNDGEWNWNYRWLNDRWNTNNPSVVLASYSWT